MPEEWSKGAVRALAARRGIRGVATVSGGDLYENRGGGHAKAAHPPPSAATVHAQPHGQTGTKAGAGVMTDSKGGKYKIAPSGKKQYLGK
jgi:hypothetical protein